MTNNTRTILIAEDDYLLRCSMRFTLRSKGYHVVPVANGHNAIDILLHNDNMFDLVITDLQMPVVDGFQLIDKINRLSISLPVIVTSAYDERKTLIQLMQKGCKDFLNKPFSSTDLINCVNRVFKKSTKYNPTYSTEA